MGENIKTSFGVAAVVLSLGFLTNVAPTQTAIQGVSTVRPTAVATNVPTNIPIDVSPTPQPSATSMPTPSEETPTPSSTPTQFPVQIPTEVNMGTQDTSTVSAEPSARIN